MAGAEFRQAQRQLAIAAEALAEDLDMARAVHRLQRQDLLLVRHLGDEHVLAELLPVAGGLPERAVQKLRGPDLLVSGIVQPPTHILFGALIQAPAIRVPEDAAGRLLLKVEQVHLLGDSPVVAALRLFELVKIGVEFLLVAPSGAVNAAQHGVAVIPTPIGAGDLHQLECRPDIARTAHMRPAAEVDPVPLRIKADGLRPRQVLNDLRLVFLALVFEELDRLIAVHHAAPERSVARDDLPHLRLDGGKVLRREGLVAGEIVVEPVLDRRPDRHLSAGVQRLHRLGQHVGGVMTD